MESPNLIALLRLSLEEDLGRGDLSALAVPAEKIAEAKIVAKGDCVASCLFLAPLLLREQGARAEISLNTKDGDFLPVGSTVGVLRGNARDLLGVERTLLNFWQRLFGIATQARALAEKKLPVRLLDTRKTTPAFRLLEKQAVRDGGLHNHRFSLDSGVLLKENHLRAGGGIRAALERLAKDLPHLATVEVEVTSEAEALEAIGAGVQILLLDNFSPEELGRLVPRLRQKKNGLFLEASGGIRPGNLAAYAQTGVDAISLGFLTHSAPAADLSLLFEFR